jgi:hypothetical protein
MLCPHRYGFAILLLVAATPRCLAQAVAVAEVGGVVSDQSGAPLPRAQVTITKTDTQLVRTTTTDDQGRYTLSNLPVGPYQLKVTASGFKTFMQSGIVLQVGNNVQINVPMQVGALSENVQVTASTEMVETKENTIAQVIDQRRIVDLPLNGRQPTQLILLSGAAFTTPAGDLASSKNYFSSTTISVAGGQGEGLNYLLDGAEHVDSFSNVNLPIPFPDALQEFSVQTSSVPARYGLHPAGVVNAVTRSGTNEYHGDAFEFLRNGKVNARNFFAPTPDTLKRNQFGGTVGGKIIRDKLFFFAGFQGTRNRSNPPQSVSFVPNQAVLNGDFSTIDSSACVAGGKGKTLTDPLTGKPFPGNIIPPSRFNQQALNLLKYIPPSSDPCGKIVYGVPTTGDENQWIGRMDWAQSSKNTLFLRAYTTGYGNPGVFLNNNILTTSRPGNLERASSATIGDTYTFSGTTVNAFHVSATRRRDDRGSAPNVPNLEDLGLNIFDPLKNGMVLTVNNYFTAGCGTCLYSYFNVNSYQIADDVDLIRGKHQIAFGVDYFRKQLNSVIQQQINGVPTFNGQFTNDALADFVLGLLSSWQQNSSTPRAIRQHVFQLYAQDSIRISQRLTLNVGLRWEPLLPINDRYHDNNYFAPQAYAAGQHSQVFPNAPAGVFFYGDPGIPGGYSNSKLNVWDPRAGIVWDPAGNGRQSIRIGGAIVHEVQELYGPGPGLPFASGITFPSPAGGFTNPYLDYPGGNPYPLPSPPPKNITFPTGGSYGDFPSIDLNVQPTYTVQWNVSYQRELPGTWLATISYLGNKTAHIWIPAQINPAIFIPGNCGASACSTTSNTNQRRVLYLENPAQGVYFGGVGIQDMGTNANYNGMLVSIQHRFADNFTLLSNYTWSHCIDEADYLGPGSSQAFQSPYNRKGDRGACGFDHRHVSNTSLVAVSPIRGAGWMGRAFGSWEFAPIISVRSGDRLNVLTGTDNSLTGQGQDRPNVVLSSSYAAHKSVALWLNPAAFVPNAMGTFGNFGRNALFGPGNFAFDASLSRRFALGEWIRLEARFEAFNAINHTNFNNPTTTLNSSNFGKLLGAGDPRILQFAVKVHY